MKQQKNKVTSMQLSID